MRTFVFYSYKGGVGRSLATAQLAVLLARAGKSVCAIDFDFEAPGLHHKFGPGLIPRPDTGLVDYINDFVEKRVMEAINKKVIPIHVEGKGFIHLFPAGNVLAHKMEYWKKISDEKFHRFMAFLSGDPNAEDFFKKFREKIEKELKPAPEYLLIDSRSGINELAGICTRLLADEVIFFNANNEETFEGTRLILSSFEDAREKNEYVPKKSHLVLSRVPQYYFSSEGEDDEDYKFKWFSDEDLDNVKRRALNFINLGLKDKLNIVYPFRSEPRLQENERLPIGLSGPAMRSQLSNDYIEFFKVLVPEVESKLDDFLNEITIFRPYLLIEKMGKIINPEDETWNVAFRVETFLTMLSTLYEESFNREREHIFEKGREKGVEDSLAEKTAKEEAEKIASEVLFKAGKSAAHNFSVYLKEQWEKVKKKYKKTPSLNAKLDEWCKFDSTVGFGKFGNMTLGDAKEGEINLVNNFLVYKRKESDHNLCDFMRGYITSILSVIFDPEPVCVTHDLSEDCGQYKDSDPKVCTFHFKVEN
ncbi:MAG: P-loop NTPase [Candidatus Aminicenantes bacterium]|nr:P-loop NTPase [Candidatus Aminicenantes bacterium]